MLAITEIKEKKQWEDFLDHPQILFYPLFQSWNFGEVQKNMGNSVWRFGIFDGPNGAKKKNLVAVFQVIDVNARRGHYLHVRHGPVLIPFNQHVFDFFLEQIKDLGKKTNASFIRLSPIVPREMVDSTMLKKRGLKNSPIHRMDAEVCWVLDLGQKPEEELLKNMRKSHRYLIKKAISDKEISDMLTIKKTKDPKDIEKFLPLYTSLSQRKHFVPHRGVREEFEVFGKDDEEILYLAEYSGKVIAGALIAFVGQTAIYRHSASDEAYRVVPAMYALLWEAIKDAKKRDKKIFNFWGIAPSRAARHPWQGLTLFKTGFGGEKKEFLHAQDLPLKAMYWKTFAIEYVSKTIKGY